MQQETLRHYRIRGMDCAEEVAVLKREVGPLVGGDERLSFDILRSRMSVATLAVEVPEREILKAVLRTGMRAEVWREGTPEADAAERGGDGRRGRALLSASSGLLVLAGFLVHAALAGGIRAALGSEGMGAAPHAVPWAARALYLPAILAGLWTVAPKAWFALRRLRPDMNLLMTIAVLGAIGLHEWFEAATVAFLFAVSLALESWSVGRARRALATLLDLAPRTARVRQPDGREEEVPAERVEVGARLVVRPGERFPLDGRVVRGASEVNQAPITGESAPVEKGAGDEVFAGTINGHGGLEIESTRRAGETTLAGIIRLVEAAQSRKAPSEQWVERFARVYTPAVMGLAFAVLLLPPLLFGAAWSAWAYRALVLLVIACPCALVISTPVSVVAALTAAARGGVLIKGGRFVEIPARLKAVALDKTGTLTAGRPAVVEVVPLADHDRRGLLARAAALEARSEHPLARAILAAAEEEGIEIQAAEDFHSLPGKGASGRIAGREYWLGSHRYLEERGQETGEVHERLSGMAQGGRSVVAVGTADHVCGLIAVADPVRPEARDAVRALRQAGIESIVMLTGDNRETAAAIARESGLSDFQSEMLPQQKVKAVLDLVARFGAVAMIGDGINDAPAMAAATLSVAMGAMGTDTAIETADVVLMSDDLSRLAWLIRHSRRTLRVIRENIALSLLVKAAFVVLAFAGRATIWAAIAADMGTSLLVIGNGLRLTRSRAE